MITKLELQDFARIKRLSLGNAEKDYLLDLSLLALSRHVQNELVFKGGTCLYKFYKLNRFSEDLDFSATETLDVGKLLSIVVQDLERFGVRTVVKEIREPHNSILITLHLQGPLYQGMKQTIASIGIDINMKSPVILPPIVKEYRPLYPDVPSFSILCMATEEICAEKIRAIISRKKARDLFDLYFLLQQEVQPDKLLIQEKINYYRLTFSLSLLEDNINLLEKQWKQDLQGLLIEYPTFGEVKLKVLRSLKHQ